MCKRNASAGGQGVAAAARLNDEDAPHADTPSSFINPCDLSERMVADGRGGVRAASMTTDALPPSVRARDVVAFGREVGRVLSDGRIVGRAEPFAKVYASTRDGWQLHDEAERLRAARSHSQQRHDDARRLRRVRSSAPSGGPGWAAAISSALTDTQLTAAVQRVTRPVGGLDRHNSTGQAARRHAQ